MHDICLFLTALLQIVHGCLIGPGCRLISPDSNKINLKYAKVLRNFNLDRA